MEKNIVSLKSNNFNTKGNDLYINGKKDNKYGMMLIWADWCGHCIRFKPEYIKLSEMLNSERATFPMYSIESTDIDNGNEQFKKNLNFRGFPTIKFVDPSGKILGDYTGSRETGSILKAICQLHHDKTDLSCKLYY